MHQFVFSPVNVGTALSMQHPDIHEESREALSSVMQCSAMHQSCWGSAKPDTHSDTVNYTVLGSSRDACPVPSF